MYHRYSFSFRTCHALFCRIFSKTRPHFALKRLNRCFWQQYILNTNVWKLLSIAFRHFFDISISNYSTLGECTPALRFCLSLLNEVDQLSVHTVTFHLLIGSDFIIVIRCHPLTVTQQTSALKATWTAALVCFLQSKIKISWILFGAPTQQEVRSKEAR